MFDPFSFSAAEDPFAGARREMVLRDVRQRGIEQPRVLAALSKVPRELFMPAELRHLAYEDQATGIGYEQTISQPYIVALMSQALEPGPGDRVLEVGTGSGYQAAILAELAAEVYTIERIPELAATAREALTKLGYENVHCLVGDGTLGYPAAAPYDRIIVTAASDQVPEPLWAQLVEGGRLVMPVGPEKSQRLQVIQKQDGQPRQQGLVACRFVPLLGAAGRRQED